jgi:hypothetical protein
LLTAILFLFSFIASPAHAASSGAEFLLLDMDARVTAQGGAAVARPADLDGLRSNPAALAGLPGYQASFTHLSAFDEWDHDWLAMAFPWGGNTFGLEILNSHLHPFTYYDDQGQAAGTLNAGALQGAVSLARRFSEFSVGVTGRLFRGQLAEYSNWGYAGDAGLQWRPRPWLCMGVAAQHFGEETSYYAESDPLPSLWRMGMQLESPDFNGIQINPGLDVVQYLDVSRGTELHVGGEANFEHIIALRGGGIWQDDAWSPTFGLGFQLGGLQLSYAYRPIDSLGANHTITLSLQDLSAFSSEPGAKN